MASPTFAPMNPKDAPLAPPEGMRHVAMQSRRGPARSPSQDWVADEVPVALEYNGISHAVMLATPADLEDFALGFSFTEGIVGAASDVRDIEVVRAAQGITVQLEIASSRFASLKDRRRTLAGRTGCGLCGTENLSEAVRVPAALTRDVRFEVAAVLRAMESLRASQPLHAATGATHAAAFCDAAGEIVLVREDVGRHNALDKLVGALLRAGIDGPSGFVAITSRASYEMVGKTARAGITLLAAVSGVTGLAIDVADAAHLCLAGFARGDHLNLYTHAERLA